MPESNPISNRQLPFDFDPEIWKPVVGYEGVYEVSDHGRVRRTKPSTNTWKHRILKPAVNTENQCRVQLCRFSSNNRGV